MSTQRADPVEPDHYVPLVVLAGATREGIKMTAVQITKLQDPNEELHCPFGNINVLSSVCYALGGGDVLDDLLKRLLDELMEQVGVVAPESEDPAAIVTYGSVPTHAQIASRLGSVLIKYGRLGREDDD